MKCSRRTQPNALKMAKSEKHYVGISQYKKQKNRAVLYQRGTASHSQAKIPGRCTGQQIGDAKVGGRRFGSMQSKRGLVGLLGQFISSDS